MDSNCSACHMKTLSCHIKKLIDIKALHAAWESSFHNSLLKESFHGCPHLNCVRCHPRLAELELKRPLLTSL